MVVVYVSSIIPAPVARVWSIIRDFNGLPHWTPFVAASRIEDGGPADRVGCIRNFVLHDGGVIRETLLSLDDLSRTMTYDIIVSPMGVTNYKATLVVRPVTDGDTTFAEWTASFDTPPGREDELRLHISNNVFQAAFDHLKGLVGRPN